ncbi:MAG: DNA-binding protein [Candidatus Doudnabacteria bacterium RIFCSPLOWO2_02_FULL_42_9]|uniref:DNA-binding protein n=1 Tax=Candidatus Doudnabacteria bacterium RIFCSPHIGHO2_01_FULL_41_86 TaxID=1817821 RepID=A0A1F5N8G3_9BACT|nr:MAG: DNA-binding protein [Candidatus Doudnabacteria bacterium RIFCSPHIGHO2_01_FULL_41_86]OGE75112.1 MAG: DNA-binding protein [Candidatus Doudnabacteria bacterium RIFCSPHIGHO2_01_43_10]OGE86373.1 MAG: DNA-binding protein [Candidatus Doudnabacteria bacterium RIFCSPHIGHO2_12_FULL_42_22]OGE87372.1 MAG: DNA-binding protein [Candidatus Doudnabacteria bacterium RIFCSPHIGHO2_02_FULL_42_25]OGE92670.1 MAG: DNA-binding protein [Candidatus Doudnabacteria bacterium RIFCSPLOWO2_01_FULL_42_60]OGE92951.1 M
MKNNLLISERIESKIYLIRGKKVMFDGDLAELYGVETKMLNRAVRRNRDRFPVDFMFQLNQKEIKIWENLRFQFGTSSLGHGGRRYPPMVFTEQGIAMLSSVLNSKGAIQVNIQIMRTFTKLREMLATNRELREKIEKLERKYDQRFKIVFNAIRNLLSTETKPTKEIGFK